MNDYDIKFMKTALEEAAKSGNDENELSLHRLAKQAVSASAPAAQDVPVGAVLVYNNEIITKAHNCKELENDATSHAEIIVIKEASKKIKNWRLNNTVLYVTLEPCPMCAAAILYSRIPKIVFGAYDPLYGAFGSTMDMRDLIKFNPEIIGGILEEDCSKILKTFFRNKRNIKE